MAEHTLWSLQRKPLEEVGPAVQRNSVTSLNSCEEFISVRLQTMNHSNLKSQGHRMTRIEGNSRIMNL